MQQADARRIRVNDGLGDFAFGFERLRRVWVSASCCFSEADSERPPAVAIFFLMSADCATSVFACGGVGFRLRFERLAHRVRALEQIVLLLADSIVEARDFGAKLQCVFAAAARGDQHRHRGDDGGSADRENCRQRASGGAW